MKIIIFSIFIFIFIIICFYTLNIYFKPIERFCKFPKVDSQGDINDKNVLLDYPPQSNIFTSSCDKYWKDWPLEKNNTLVDNEPIVIKSDQLALPKEKEFASNSYVAGLMDFKKLASIVNDKFDEDIFKVSTELLIEPVTQEKLEYQYQLDYAYIDHNKKTWINRWQQYNPALKNTFKYDEIKSPIEKLNILNLEFRDRCNIFQKELLTPSQLVLFGIIPFDIFKYKILHVNYLNSVSVPVPVYIIQICLYRESDLYINTFSYIGFFKDNIPMIINTNFIGRNSTDTVLLPDFYNKNEITQEIINKNFSNSPIIEKDPDVIVAMTKAHKESYKIKNQYACFNVNYDAGKKNEYLIPYYSRETCESQYDSYGKKKDVGVYDTPCKKNEDCPFYKVNKNYENNFGKCMEDGYCELPENMERIGYRYFKNHPAKLPLCYNCNTTAKRFNVITELNTCCEDQFDKNKYPFLKTPDYSFQDDTLARKNFFNNKYCKEKSDSQIICEDIVL